MGLKQYTAPFGNKGRRRWRETTGTNQWGLGVYDLRQWTSLERDARYLVVFMACYYMFRATRCQRSMPMMRESTSYGTFHLSAGI